MPVKQNEKEERKYSEDDYETKDKELKNKENKESKVEYRNKINLVYFTESEGIYNIFGEEFGNNNYNNLELIINGHKEELYISYKLEKGNNNITLVIKNKITDRKPLLNALLGMLYGISIALIDIILC